MKHTPFHGRLAPLNQTALWEHWAGHLAATQYEHSVLFEYYAVRNAVGLLDTSPLFKYRIAGPDAEQLLAKVLLRDIRRCSPGRAQYTAWCDDAGFVLEDGVILRLSSDEYLLASAERNLRHFSRYRNGLDVTIEDISADFGVLALQGPHALSVLGQLVEGLETLGYFGVRAAMFDGVEVVISRTGFTGDLGYEVWVPVAAAEAVFDAVMEAGRNFNISPLGLKALSLARIEAGLLLIGVDFDSARHAWTDAQRETPSELGWDWMLGDLAIDDRQFVGRGAIEAARAHGSARWKTVGFAVDWREYDDLHREAGVMTPKDGLLIEATMSIYRRSATPWDYAGYATSFMWSSVRKQHIGIAKLPLDLAALGTEVDLEISIIRRPTTVRATVVPLPFFDPDRKRARPAP